jgi:hypothetical protein
MTTPDIPMKDLIRLVKIRALKLIEGKQDLIDGLEADLGLIMPNTAKQLRRLVIESYVLGYTDRFHDEIRSVTE